MILLLLYVNWRQALEANGLRLIRSKTECMECNFSKRRNTSSLRLKLEIMSYHKLHGLNFLGPCTKLRRNRSRCKPSNSSGVGWNGGALCDTKEPLKLKRNFYCTFVRLVVLHGAECWEVKNQHENKTSLAGMRMLCWMCGKTRQDKIRNDNIRESWGSTYSRKDGRNKT